MSDAADRRTYHERRGAEFLVALEAGDMEALAALWAEARGDEQLGLLFEELLEGGPAAGAPAAGRARLRLFRPGHRGGAIRHGPAAARRPAPEGEPPARR